MNNLNQVENKLLIESIKTLKENPSMENEQKFFDEFKKSRVIVPVKFKPEPKFDKDNNLILSNDVEINFLLINDINKKSYYPAFLDFESFNKWKNNNSDVYNIMFDYKGFYNLLNNTTNVAIGVAIDPFGLNIICNKSLINKLNGDKQEENLEKPIISDPKIYPTSMVNALYDYCLNNKDINKAYIKSLIYKNQVKFGIILDKTCNDEIFENMKTIAQQFSKGIDLVFLNIDNELIKNSIKDTDIPFYEK